MRNLFATLILFMTFATLCYAQDDAKIKNYKTFISAFKATDAAVTYQSNKTKIENLANNIKSSNLSEATKNELAVKYNKIVKASEMLYYGFITDLKTTKRRKEIIEAPAPYLDSLQSKMQNVSDLCAAFATTYIEATSSKKDIGAILVPIIKEIVIPLAKEFLNEVIVPKLIDKYGEKYLKPYVIFAAW